MSDSAYDHAASERATQRLRIEHRADIAWLPGEVAWFCSCGARSVVSGSYRTERQANASRDRHLRGERRRIYDEERGIFVPIAIRRDRTFTYRGKQYRVAQDSTRGTKEWDGYSIVAVLSCHPGHEADIQEGFWSIADVRAYLARAQAEGWEYLPDVDGANPHTRA
ncbi:hypothetical protein [Microbacterium sp. 77mftsu3.1]|uniref:hypothetical protein n=1 Tax=Microbacterium sp. 77mftsu3.1 TaxID=1761802 RepID=UPI000361389A|nr:hypothetical protein [Microbacterium sp. 77mftsu3.1]SDH33879.1 hypothetical protein SAMN04488590_3068 [Microbacterium sp. 77mftsu3.1]